MAGGIQTLEYSAVLGDGSGMMVMMLTTTTRVLIMMMMMMTRVLTGKVCSALLGYGK